MKIERISENKLKIELNKKDLMDRGIELSELAYGNDKTRELFHELLSQAVEDFDFQIDDTPLMIEAMPSQVEAMTIIVTRVVDRNNLKNNLKKVSDVSAFLQAQGSIGSKNSGETSSQVLIFSFDNINPIISVAKTLKSKIKCDSSIYKIDSAYYLILENFNTDSLYYIPKVEATMYEYGNKHISNSVSKMYVLEHGSPIIKRDALKKLSNNF